MDEVTEGLDILKGRIETIVNEKDTYALKHDISMIDTDIENKATYTSGE